MESKYNIDSFKKAMEEIAHFRSAEIGRLICPHTHLRLERAASDLFEGKSVAIVRYHKTDILRFHSDGLVELALNSWCTSHSTKSRLWSMAHKSISLCAIPAVNGYKTSPSYANFIGGGWREEPRYAYNSNNGGFIRMRNGVIDPKSVVPHVVECVKNTRELRKVMIHLGRITKVLIGYDKLVGNADVFNKATENMHKWLMDRYKIPLDQLVIVPLPRMNVGDEIRSFGRGRKWNNPTDPIISTSVRSEIRNALDGVRLEIARREGWLAPHEVLLIE